MVSREKLKLPSKIKVRVLPEINVNVKLRSQMGRRRQEEREISPNGSRNPSRPSRITWPTRYGVSRTTFSSNEVLLALELRDDLHAIWLHCSELRTGGVVLTIFPTLVKGRGRSFFIRFQTRETLRNTSAALNKDL